MHSKKQLIEFIKNELTQDCKLFAKTRTTQIKKFADIQKQDRFYNQNYLLLCIDYRFVFKIASDSLVVKKIAQKPVKFFNEKIGLVTIAKVFANLDKIVCFTEKGKAFIISVFDIPVYSEKLSLDHYINFSDVLIKNKDKIKTIIRMDESKEYLMVLTRNGFLVKIKISELIVLKKKKYVSVISLRKSDSVVFACCCAQQHNDLIVISKNAKCVRTKISNIAVRKRGLKGVKVMKLDAKDYCVSIGSSTIIEGKLSDDKILLITKNGTGKLLKLSTIRSTNKNTKGVKLIPQNSNLQFAILIDKKQRIFCLGVSNYILSFSTDQIRELGRYAKGRLVWQNAKYGKILNIS